VSDDIKPHTSDKTNRDGFAALAVLGLTILFIVAIIVFAIA